MVQKSDATLSGSLRDYQRPTGSDLLDRLRGFFEWQDARRQADFWPYSRTTNAGPQTECEIADDFGRIVRGVNFGSQDYLGLSRHPEIASAAHQAIQEFGVHSAGSPAFLGNTTHSRRLERVIGEFLQMEHVLLFPTGYAAGAGAIKGLVRSSDYVVMDALAHACLQDGASSATKNVFLFRHLDNGSAERWLKHIRAKDSENAILVVTEGLFSMDSDTPALAGLQDLCSRYGATLMVDVAHDLGSLGPQGRGHVGSQDLLGKCDIVMGSFSKTFASNGGFVAVKDPHVREYLRYFATPGTFSNALSPVQAAVVAKAFEIVSSDEGDVLRARLLANVSALRAGLHSLGLEIYGDPSAIVAAKMGDEALGRLVSRNISARGLIANLVEYPAVARGAARFRLQVMATHTPEQISAAVEIMRSAIVDAREELTQRPLRHVA